MPSEEDGEVRGADGQVAVAGVTWPTPDVPMKGSTCHAQYYSIFDIASSPGKGKGPKPFGRAQGLAIVSLT